MYKCSISTTYVLPQRKQKTKRKIQLSLAAPKVNTPQGPRFAGTAVVSYIFTRGFHLTGVEKTHVSSMRGGAWRIIPVSKWSITMVIVSPLSRVVGPFPNGLNGL